MNSHLRTLTAQPPLQHNHARYDTAGRALSVADSGLSINYATNATYAPQGAVSSVQNGAGFYFTELFNKRLQPCWIYAHSASTPRPTNCTQTGVANAGILDLQYDFGLGAADNGNVSRVVNRRNPVRSITYQYDELNRIKSAVTDATSGQFCWGQSFVNGYDPWANLKTISPDASRPGCAVGTLSKTINAYNKIVDTGFAYDNAGNMTAQPGLTSTFNAENQMTSSAGVTYTYDGDGKRVKKSNGKLYWYGMGSDPLDETDLAGNTNNSSFNEYIFFAGNRIARRDSSNNVFYYFTDRLGTSRAIAQAGQGTACYDADFYPFGGEAANAANACSQNYKFTGKERDPESGLDNFVARYDSSGIGRFMSPDPLGGHRVDPQTLNKYSYVRNNPVNLTDPTGLDFNLTCTQTRENASTCQNGVQGTTTTDANGKSTFTATVISNDKNGNLVDQNGNQYNAAVSGAGVSFNQAGSNQPGSMGVFINGSNATTIQGTGGLSRFTFNFTYSNWFGNVTAGGTFSYNGTFQQAESALEKAGFHHYGSDEYDIFHPSGLSYHAVDFRSAGEVGTGAGSGHFTVDEPWMFYPYDALRSPTNGDVHFGEHNNSTPGGFWPHTGEVIRTLLDKTGFYPPM